VTWRKRNCNQHGTPYRAFGRLLLTFTTSKKISVLQHAPEVHLPLRPGDPTPTSRNLDPLMHPFARARERIRALNAAKMDRIFAKPFIGSIEGHIDAVEVLARQRGSLTTVASGSWDGGAYLHMVAMMTVKMTFPGIILHDLRTRHKLLNLPQAHKGKVSGLCFADPDRLLSCGVDRNIKLWAIGSGASDTVCQPLPLPTL
jgi:WD repeat and SOF domain-containing protein 1